MTAAWRPSPRCNLKAAHGPWQTFLALDDPPSAVYVYNDQLAIEVLQYLAQRGVHVPEDVAVIGFDDIRSAKMTAPPLSTIRYSLDEIADHAVCALRARRTEPDAPPVRRVMPVELVIRQSTVGCIAQDFSPSFAVESVVAII